MKLLFTIFFLINSILYAEINYKVENSNIQIDDKYSYNYNRLRLNLDYIQDRYFAKVIADGVNYYSDSYTNSYEFYLLSNQKADTPLSVQTSYKDYAQGEMYAKLYRAYAGYEDNKNLLSIGLQNITMGVGRFWTPTNLFNPKNIYAIEVDETFGVMALSYVRHIDDTSDINVVASIKEDETLKYAARYKSFLDYSDAALSFIYSDKTKMLGYELEGNLGDTGVEIRSEGAYIESKLLDKKVKFSQAILGADYGFVNGVNITFETLYSSKEFNNLEMLSNLNSEILPNMTLSKFYAGGSISYTFNIFLDGSLMYIDSFEGDEEAFSSATFNYTLNDYNLFTFGFMHQEDKTFYLKYQFSF